MITAKSLYVSSAGNFSSVILGSAACNRLEESGGGTREREGNAGKESGREGDAGREENLDGGRGEGGGGGGRLEGGRD